MRYLRHLGKVCLLLAVLCVGLALFKPQWPLARTVYHYVVILDISQSMNTRDYTVDGPPQDRLTVSKQAVKYALEHLPCGSTLGLGLFTANNTYQLFSPLEVCEHYSIINTTLGHIDWRMAWANDSLIQYGLFAAIKLLSEEQEPPRLVFLSDGDQSPKSDRQPAFMGEAGVPGGWLVGVGGDVPTPVPHLAADGSINGYWTRAEALNNPALNAAQAQLYLSQLDETNLKRLADLTGMAYLRLQTPESLLAALQNPINGRQRVVETDLRGWLGGLAIVLLLLSAWPVRARPIISPVRP